MEKKFKIFVVLGLISFIPFKIKNVFYEKEVQETEEIDFYEQSLSEKKKMVVQEIIKNKIQYPEIVLAQALLESANFNSYIFKKNNNMFGMRMPNRRETHAIGTYKTYAVYEDWKMSIQDYALYQKAVLKGRDISKENYYAFLGRRYAESPEYVTVIKKMVKKIEKENIVPYYL